MSTIHRPFDRRTFLKFSAGAAGLSLIGAAPWERDGLLPLRALATGLSGFPVDGRVASNVLQAARSRGAAFADLYLETRIQTRVTMAESRIESVQQGILSGSGIRAVDGDRTGYAYTDSFEEAAMVEAARNAAAIAAQGSGPSNSLIFQMDEPNRKVRYLRPMDEVRQDERIAWLKRADEAARAFDPAVKQVTIEYTDEMQRFAVINTDGRWVEDALPLLYLRVNVVAQKGERRGTGLDRVSFRLGAEQMDNDAPGKSGIAAARMAVAMCDAQEAPAGEMPVILAAGGGVLFHEAVGHGLEGDFARRGTSFYTGRVGEQIASDRVSVVDYGGIPELRGSYNVDDEGNPPVKNYLIMRGILQGFLTDRITAQALDTATTGNGRRQSYRFPPLVRMSNTYLLEGADTVEQMIKETKRGLYAKTLGGGEVDTTSGNFTFGVMEAYRIEDGKIGPAVRGANLVGNGPEVMKRIDRVAADLVYWPGTCGKGQWVPISSGAPTLRISSMTVGGSNQG